MEMRSASSAIAKRDAGANQIRNERLRKKSGGPKPLESGGGSAVAIGGGNETAGLSMNDVVGIGDQPTPISIL